jgi:hypothetical protein
LHRLPKPLSPSLSTPYSSCTYYSTTESLLSREPPFTLNRQKLDTTTFYINSAWLSSTLSPSHKLSTMSDGPPPAYEDATQSKKAQFSRPANYASYSHLAVPRNGIPPLHRRSMEDEGRPLPPGWIRQYDAKESHQFFVDTNTTPPRSIWHHPYDDDQYLSTLSS